MLQEQLKGHAHYESVINSCSVIINLQAIGDPGQGWGNAIVYVMLSPMVRRKLIPQACHDWFKSSINWLVSLASASLREERQPLQTTGEHHNAEQQSSYSSSRPRVSTSL